MARSSDVMKVEDCDNCGDGSGWIYDAIYGWVGCADCNDDLEKPKPTWKAIEQSLN
jgi:hypothetical protein